MSEPTDAELRELGRRILHPPRFGSFPVAQPKPSAPTRAEKVRALLERDDVSSVERDAAIRALVRMRRAPLVERLAIVVDCLSASVAAYRLGLHARDRVRGGLSEPVSVWFGRAEASLRFALAELSYLTGPAPR